MTVEEQRWIQEVYRYAQAWGLSGRASRAYTALSYWGAFYGIPPQRIISGRRSPERNQELIDKWDAGERTGLAARPVSNSLHLRGDAFDLQIDQNIALAYGDWMRYIPGAEWGGHYSNPDPNHFEVNFVAGQYDA